MLAKLKSWFSNNETRIGPEGSSFMEEFPYKINVFRVFGVLTGILFGFLALSGFEDR